MNSNNREQLKYRAYDFSIKIVKFVTNLPNERIYWVLSDQLLRAATSIGANIIEAQAASSKRDFIKFYEIALKSANETKYWLGILRDATETNRNEVNILLEETKKSIEYLRCKFAYIKRETETLSF